jgi:hypothetical protein
MLLAVVGPLVLWQLAQPLLPSTSEQSAVSQFSSATTDTERTVAWQVITRAALDRPLLGWGPGTTGDAFVASASNADLQRASALWADAHNIFLETFVTTGFLGLAALVVLLALVVPRALRAGPERAWTLGAAAVLGAYALIEPIGIVLTPLLFLFAGMAAGPGAEREMRAEPAAAGPARVGLRAVTGVLLAAALVVSVLMLAAGALEEWGNTEGEPWAYRAALRLQPWRLNSAELLAVRLSVDGRAGDATAATEARATIARAVAEHPWDPRVRLKAADVELLLRNLPASRRWIRLQTAKFPVDPFLLGPGADAVRPTAVSSPP